MRKFIIYLVPFFFFNCSAQKDTLVIKEVVLETYKEDILLSQLDINDYNLKEHYEQLGLKIIINDKNRYQYKDSVLVNANVTIWLHSDFESDIGPFSYGYLKGKIIDGKREGEWFKKIKISKKPHYQIVKTFNYTNGVLDGKYQVFDANGDVLYYLEPHPLFLEEYKNFETFKNGTGRYYDYYYETGVLKVKGRYKNNKKHSSWMYYDSLGKEILIEFYRDGILIN